MVTRASSTFPWETGKQYNAFAPVSGFDNQNSSPPCLIYDVCKYAIIVRSLLLVMAEKGVRSEFDFKLCLMYQKETKGSGSCI